MNNIAEMLDTFQYPLWILDIPSECKIDLRPGAIMRGVFPRQVQFVAPAGSAWMRGAVVVESSAA